ncbi:SAM-dependent methyltransferase [Streptomyces sp. NPDC059076]|uniref:SAM-dependent methyltransferase n=1 Tax=unclassified Streptomyces TaxID=2593676 RepID=UPI0036CA021B
MTQPLAPQGVGQTAVAVAKFRATESRRSNRLFNDPFAKHFVAAAGPIRRGPGSGPRKRSAWRLLGQLLHPANYAHYRAMPHFIAVRTRFFDDFLRSTTPECRQVVILAAGLDTRAYRLDLPSDVCVFEIDLPEVLAFKESVVAGQQAEAPCKRTAVPVDLRNDWPAALMESGFRLDQPTAWTAEGLLVYLSESESAQLLERIGELSAPGSRLALGHQDRSTVQQQVSNPLAGAAQSLYRSGLTRDPVEWLASYGWRANARRAAQYATDYGRKLTADVGAAWFVTAERE